MVDATSHAAGPDGHSGLTAAIVLISEGGGASCEDKVQDLQHVWSCGTQLATGCQ